MSKLSNILRVSTITVEEMPLFYEFLQLSSSSPVIISRTHLDQLIAHFAARHHNYRDLALHTHAYLIQYIKHSICHQNAHYLAATHPLGSLLALSDSHTQVHLELYLASPFQVLLWVVYVARYVLNRNKWVWPFASSVPSTCDGLIFGNFISPSGATPMSLTPRLRVNFSSPEANPLSTMAASVLKAARAMPAQNFPLPFSMAPMMLITGVISVYLNLSSMSRIGRFFLQMLLILISLASFPPGNRKSYGFQRSYFTIVFCTLTMEFFMRDYFSSSLAASGDPYSCFYSIFADTFSPSPGYSFQGEAGSGDAGSQGGGEGDLSSALLYFKGLPYSLIIIMQLLYERQYFRAADQDLIWFQPQLACAWGVTFCYSTSYSWPSCRLRSSTVCVVRTASPSLSPPSRSQALLTPPPSASRSRMLSAPPCLPSSCILSAPLRQSTERVLGAALGSSGTIRVSQCLPIRYPVRSAVGTCHQHADSAAYCTFW